MLNSTKEFIDFLNQNNLCYHLDETTQNGNEQVSMHITSQILPEITIHFLFDANNQIVYIRIWNLLKFPACFHNAALNIINDLNNTYRFARFYLNTDEGIDIFVDSFIQAGMVGQACMNLGIIIAKICDTVYPKLAESFRIQQL